MNRVWWRIYLQVKFDFIYMRCGEIYYDDVIMSTIASQITSLTIVYLTIYSGADQSKHQSSASLAFVWGIHRGPVNLASNAENVSIWWRHHVSCNDPLYEVSRKDHNVNYRLLRNDTSRKNTRNALAKFPDVDFGTRIGNKGSLIVLQCHSVI